MQDLIFTQDVDILFLAETFLTDTVADNVLSISNYTLHRRDRPTHGGQPTHGGGLAAYVKSSYQTRVISNYRASQVELLAVEVKGRHTQLLLGGVYRPPGTPVIGWQDLSDAVDLAISASPTSHLVLVGDFNVDISADRSPQLNNLRHLCDSFDIRNRVSATTRIGPHGSRTTIDLVLAGDGLVESCNVVPSTISDHFPVFCSIPFATSTDPEIRRGRNIKRINIHKLTEDLLEYDLENFSTAPTIDAMWNTWLHKVVSVVDRHAPMRNYRPKVVRKRHCDWKTSELHDLVHKRDLAHRRWRSQPPDVNRRDAFTTLRAEAKRLARHLRSKHYRTLLESSHANATKTWATINLLSGRKQTTPPSTIDASRLSDHFGGVVSDPSRPRHLVSPAGPSTRDSLEEFPVCEIHEIHKLLRGLNSKKATGSDQLPAAILKSCALVLAPSLTIIVNASLTSGIVPTALKQADIRPLFKAGDREAPKNYRPVSLLPVVSKVLERVVHSRLTRFLSDHSLFPPSQFAYRAKHSTEDAVTLATDRFYEAADQQLHTGIVLVDMSKAFDKVRHQLLINDLFCVGISKTALSWFISYLSSRKQRVALVSGDTSEYQPCESGVPQGSVLGPLLFCIYTIGVEQAADPAHSQMFADDILLDAVSKSAQELSVTLSSSVSSLQSFLLAKGLILNPAKTQVLGIHSARRSCLPLNVTCQGVDLVQADSAKYLGLQLDSRLRWERQISSIVRKTSQKLTTLRQIRSCLAERQALLFYTALVLPDMLYSSSAFFAALTSQQRSKLAVLDKRCIRLVADQLFPAHTAPIYARLKLMPLMERMQCKLRLLMHRVHTGQISSLLVSRLPRQPTSARANRNCDDQTYPLPLVNRQSGDCRPLLAAAKLWNALPQILRQVISPQRFKHLLAVYFSD